LKKLTGFFIVLCLSLGITVTPALAAPPPAEVEQLLNEIGWTQEDLKNYLDYYELTLDEFSTIEELDEFLGTPITDENLEELLGLYGMTRQELDTLLAGFGETVEDYFFIEDLETSIDYYMNHDEYMKESENFLALLGLTEDEVDRFFNHLMALDQTALEAQMETVAAKLEPFLAMDPEAELSDQQIQELTAVWSEILSLLKINPKYFLVDASGGKREVSFGELAVMKTFNGKSLLLELYSDTGELLLDMHVSEEMFSSDFLLDGAKEMVDVGDLAGELTKIKHEKLPNTASSFGIHLLLSLLMVLVGLTILFATRRNQTKKC
jgi:processed acidic surface protein